MDKTSPSNNTERFNDDLQTLIASLDDIVFELDGNMVFQNVWVQDERMLFMPRDQFLSKHVSHVMGPLIEQVVDTIQQVIDTKKPAQFVYKHLDPTVDKHFRAKIVPVRADKDLSKYRLALMVQDVTEKVKQEQALAQIREELELANSILSNSQKLSKTGGWQYSLSTGIVFWTDELYDIYEVERGQTIMYDFVKTLYEPEYAAHLAEMVSDAIARQVPYEALLKTKKGKWLQTIGEPIVENGEVVKIRGAVMDVTNKIRSEQELIDAKNAAEEAARAKSDFLSVMSHEIRTPLNGIIGIANLLGQQKKVGQEELVDNLIFSSNHLLQLVNDILDLNKIDSNKLELVTDRVQLSQLVDNICNQFTPLADNKGLKLLAGIDEDIPKVVIADAVRLGQILNNLVSNAIKFTFDGSILIKLQNEHTEADQTTIRFSVKDSGIGIPEKYHDKIFETFEQVQQSSNRPQGGTGLGLAICKRLVELQGGEIEMQSEEGKGTEFFFTLSFELPKEQTNNGPMTPDDMAAYKERFAELNLLLAEDNPVNVLVARKQLENFGITAECVGDGNQALERLKEKHYDIALIDLHMPGMDGFELAAHIRSNYPGVHIVVFTADITAEARERLAMLSVYDIINKPFKPKEMLALLLKVLAV